MYLYRPYLNNPVKDAFYSGDSMIFPNYQPLEATRYSMFSNVVVEKLYNYWDRIGDLIAEYFHTLIKSEKVYFPRALDIIPLAYQKYENFRWLKDFKEAEYKNLNHKRKQIVHYVTEDTQFKFKHLNSSGEKEEMQKLFDDRFALADTFNIQLELTFTGFEKTLFLIEKITEEKLSDID
jgi:hypothetical protein